MEPALTCIPAFSITRADAVVSTSQIRTASMMRIGQFVAPTPRSGPVSVPVIVLLLVALSPSTSMMETSPLNGGFVPAGHVLWLPVASRRCAAFVRGHFYSQDRSFRILNRPLRPHRRLSAAPNAAGRIEWLLRGAPPRCIGDAPPSAMGRSPLIFKVEKPSLSQIPQAQCCCAVRPFTWRLSLSPLA